MSADEATPQELPTEQEQHMDPTNAAQLLSRIQALERAVQESTQQPPSTSPPASRLPLTN